MSKYRNGIYDLGKCVICGREISSHGQAGHALMHERKGEAIITNLSLTNICFNIPYEFAVAPREE